MLVEGLGPNSRTGMKLTGTKVPLDTLLLARVHDDIQALIWALTGEKGSNPPESLAEKLAGREKENEIKGYASAEEFEKARAEIIKKVKKWQT